VKAFALLGEMIILYTEIDVVMHILNGVSPIKLEYSSIVL